MSDKKWSTVTEIEQKHGVPAPSTRRYLQRHGHKLNIKKRGKSYLIDHESIEVLIKIRDLYSDGKSEKEIDDILSNMGVPTTITIEEEGKEIEVPTDKVLMDIRNELQDVQEFNRELLDRSDRQEEFNRQLLERLDQQQAYIDKRLDERDERLMIALRNSLETQKMIAATQEQEQKKENKGFFARFFSKKG
jgi:hypothetical protein